MDQLFSNSITLNRLKDGPFCSYTAQINEIVLEMLAQGYTILTLKNHIWLLASFGRWLSAKGVGLGSVKLQTIEEYLSSRFRGHDPRHNFAVILPRLLDKLGAIDIPGPTPTHLDPILADFARYLANERGLCESTVKNYIGFVKLLLSERFGAEPVEPPSLSVLDPSDVTAFMLRHARSFSHGRTMLLTTGLRSFFQYLVLRGVTIKNLSGAVQKVADWRQQTLPKALEPEQVQLLLEHCPRKSAVGRRDYAILLLLARLGLRGGEIAQLSLEAIDWEAGEIILFGKSRRVDRLPLPSDVGKAIAEYLRRDRPACSSRRLFLRIRAPHEGLKSSGAIADVVRRALRRASLAPPRMGSHLLRHGLAKQMLRGGASLAEIGQILRHQRVDTTAIYAKVDLEALRPLALPWPGSKS